MFDWKMKSKFSEERESGRGNFDTWKRSNVLFKMTITKRVLRTFKIFNCVCWRSSLTHTHRFVFGVWTNVAIANARGIQFEEPANAHSKTLKLRRFNRTSSYISDGITSIMKNLDLPNPIICISIIKFTIRTQCLVTYTLITESTVKFPCVLSQEFFLIFLGGTK